MKVTVMITKMIVKATTTKKVGKLMRNQGKPLQNTQQQRCIRLIKRNRHEGANEIQMVCIKTQTLKCRLLLNTLNSIEPKKLHYKIQKMLDTAPPEMEISADFKTFSCKLCGLSLKRRGNLILLMQTRIHIYNK